MGSASWAADVRSNGRGVVSAVFGCKIDAQCTAVTRYIYRCRGQVEIVFELQEAQSVG
jgi:hypothetical protein